MQLIISFLSSHDSCYSIVSDLFRFNTVDPHGVILGHYLKKYFLRESLNKFPDFFRMGTFIDSIHMKL